MSAHTGSDFDGTGPLTAIKRWLVGLAAPVFGPDTDIVNVAAHFTEYLVFGGLLVLAARRTWPALGWGKLALVAIALASLYAVTDEFHQSFVPGRVCDPADWLTDTLGAALGASAAVLALEKMLAKRQMGCSGEASGGIRERKSPADLEGDFGRKFRLVRHVHRFKYAPNCYV